MLLVVVVLVGGGAVAVWGWWTGSIAGLPLRTHCTATALGSTTELDPDQAANAAIIAAVAVERGLPGRAATIGIATAMQESKLTNLAGGDRDSVGLFQQRPSQGWGTAAEVHDPVYAANAFYDVLVKVEGYQNLPITTAAQRVQRSAFPTAYADHEAEARIWASTLTGYSAAALTCLLDPVPSSAPAGIGADGFTARARAVADAARQAPGRTGSVVPGSGGTTVRFVADGTDQATWALAQWAVASADRLGIVEVTADGRHWLRSAGAKGWTASPTASTGTTVTVRVAP